MCECSKSRGACEEIAGSKSVVQDGQDGHPFVKSRHPFMIGICSSTK